MLLNSKHTFILTISTIIISLLSNIKYQNPLLFLVVAFSLLSAVVFNVFFMILKVMHNTVKIEKVLFSLFSLILAYTLMYVALKNYDNDSFTHQETDKNEKHNGYTSFISEFFDMSYFTIVTLATVGYGDITPKSRIARFLVMSQILAGIFILSILFTKTF